SNISRSSSSRTLKGRFPTYIRIMMSANPVEPEHRCLAGSGRVPSPRSESDRPIQTHGDPDQPDYTKSAGVNNRVSGRQHSPGEGRGRPRAAAEVSRGGSWADRGRIVGGRGEQAR